MDLNKDIALKALGLLDQKLGSAKFKNIQMAIGGGGSMMLHHNYDGMTVDIDAVPTNIEFDEIKPFVAEVSIEMGLNIDWINPFYSAFTHYLPLDASVRMKEIFSGQCLTVKSLGAEDILIMKLMAGRNKDRPHIMHLKKQKLDLAIIENRIEELLRIHPAEAKKALDWFDEIFNEN
jgi:hypothetical protein